MRNKTPQTLFTFLSTLLKLAFFMGILSACNIEETEEGGAGDLFSEHQKVENSISVTVPAGGIYVEDDTLSFKVKHPYPLNVTGTPRIALDVGGATKYAEYVSGDGTKTLTFTYTIGAGEDDDDGISLASTSIDLNSGSINFDGTTGTLASSLSLGSLDLAEVLIDTTAPGAPSITPPISMIYYLGDQLSISATYDEDVFVTGSPKIPFTLSGSTVYADYVSGSGSSTLLFKYTVTSSDLDMDGISIPSPIDLNSGTIKDEAGNAATLVYNVTNHPTVYIDGDTPIVDTFIPPADGVYEPGQNLDFSLKFTELVNVTGSPRVGVDIGGTNRYAYYVSGSGTDTLLFRYSIVSGNVDEDGVDVDNVFDVNGGTIRDAGNRNAYPIFDAPITTGATIDATLPTVTSITLPTPPADGYFNSGEEIYITLSFNDVVNVTGFPQLGMELASSGSTIYIDYNTGSGTNSLVFRYIVEDEVDEDHDGLTLVSPLNLNGGTIQNDSLTNADLDMAAVAAALDTSAMLVDATTPTIASITPPANDIYAIGDQINFTVTFSEIVTVSGSPRFSLNVGGSTRYATYTGGSGSTSLNFRWTVQNNYEDTDGIEISSAAIDPRTGGIIDRGGNETDYDISGAIPDLSSVFVDGIRPVILSVTIPANTYTDGDTVTATVTFDDTVIVSGGSPTIAGNFDDSGGANNFAYQGGTGTTTLTFDYTVLVGDGDTDGIDLGASITEGGATFQDINGNDATLTLSNTNFPAVLLDAISPTAAITSPSAGDYINQTSDAVNYAITGTCDDAGATYDIQVDGVSAAGQAGVSCDGANLSGTFNTTGIGQGALSLTVVATDASANTSTSAAVAVTKDTVAPSITSITPPADGNYELGDDVDFTVNFDEDVDISGTRILITVGADSLYASYSSGSGSSTPVYRYSVGASDYDSDGIALSSPLQENGGSIQDAAGNDANLAFADPGTGAIDVNNGAPSFQWYDESMTPVALYDYLTPGVPTSETFTIENTGTAPTSASFDVSINSGGADFQEGTDNCSGNIIPINGTCTIQIEYLDLSTASGQATAQDAGRAPNPGYTLDLEGTN